MIVSFRKVALIEVKKVPLRQVGGEEDVTRQAAVLNTYYGCDDLARHE
jgi:hypothetical protein